MASRVASSLIPSALVLALLGCDGQTVPASTGSVEDAGVDALPSDAIADVSTASPFDSGAPTERVPLPLRMVPLVAGLDRAMYQCPDRVWP